MAATTTAQQLLRSEVGPDDRILLVNPPVEDARYAWLRWNQPTELLKLGTLLKSEIGCEVELLDFMKPDQSGRVHTQRLPSIAQYRVVGDETYPMWRFGLPYMELAAWITRRRAAKQPLPTQVWITSLCSYWLGGVAQVCREARTCHPDSKLVLLGNYARLLTEHACDYTSADLVVTDTFPLTDRAIDLSLYGEELPPFVGIASRPEVAVTEIESAVGRGVYRFAPFTDDLLGDGGDALREIVTRTEGLHRHVRFHLICGLYPDQVNSTVAECLARKSIAEIYFEECSANGELDRSAYVAAVDQLRSAERPVPSSSSSAFLWIGRPNESIEGTIERMLEMLSVVGGFILKPYTPTPGSTAAQTYDGYLSEKTHLELSPHFFPFSELNGIERTEYSDLYRLAALLNERVRDRTFSLFDESLGAQMLRDSLRREVWQLEANPLRVVN